MAVASLACGWWRGRRGCFSAEEGQGGSSLATQEWWHLTGAGDWAGEGGSGVHGSLNTWWRWRGTWCEKKAEVKRASSAALLRRARW